MRINSSTGLVNRRMDDNSEVNLETDTSYGYGVVV